MAASSEDSPTSTPAPSTPLFSRSSSVSSEFQWTNLLTGKTTKYKHQKHVKGRDPVVIERSNLVNISKLVVKELIEQSLKYGRMLDSDHMPLQHFFIVLEHVLRHGLKPKKGLLGPKKELWDILQTVEKYAPEAQDITASVRDLPTVRTHMGRARAWLRIALMQKKLADYLKVLIDNKDEALVEYFEPDALMLSDEAIIIIGLLVGLNVIDCNLCVKEEDLDCPQGVIDFSLYLRSPNHITSEFNTDDQGDNMVTVLDQKNYIEELNRHLNATVGNLQTKVESLTTTNALMKEDLAIAKNNLLALYEENRQLRTECGKDPAGYSMSLSGINIIQNSDKERVPTGEMEELKQRLEEERKLRQEADHELEIQMCLKAEMEVAMKLLEKDIHEKQDTIVSLRRQLDDIKLINLEMYKKLQDCEASLNHKTELVAKLESKAQIMTDTVHSLENKLKLSEDSRLSVEQVQRELHQQAAQVEEQANNVEEDLKVEREWRTALQETMQQDRERIAKLQHDNGQLNIVADKYANLQEEYYTLKDNCLEQERTLEELGSKLRDAKLKISELNEELNKTKNDGTWVSDSTATHCKSCKKEFSLTRRKVVIDDIREDFTENYVWPSVSYSLLYENRYLLGTSLARPCISVGLIKCVQENGASYVSHGATGKGNDQVRFELSCYTLLPEVKIIAPWRVEEFITKFEGRQDLLKYAADNNIPVSITPKAPWSMDANLMHISYESGVLEDPNHEAPKDLYLMSTDPKDSPTKGTRLEITFQKGVPIHLIVDDAKTYCKPLDIFQALNEIGGKHGVGRIDIVENRFLGLKSRGVYETPGITILHQAHIDLEVFCLDKELYRIKQVLRDRLSDYVYNGFWFSPEGVYTRKCLDLAAETVEGIVKLEVYKGSVTILARSSKASIYNADLVSMDKHSGFSPQDATGFINIQAIRLKEYHRFSNQFIQK